MSLQRSRNWRVVAPLLVCLVSSAALNGILLQKPATSRPEKISPMALLVHTKYPAAIASIYDSATQLRTKTILPEAVSDNKTNTITPNATVIGNTLKKNLRTAAGLEHDVITEVTRGDRVQVLDHGRDEHNSIWYLVKTLDGHQGWINGPLLQLDNDLKDTDSLDLDKDTTKRDNGAMCSAATAPVERPNATIGGIPSQKRLRAGPGTSYPIVHRVRTGDRVFSCRSKYGEGQYVWHEVSVPGTQTTGWIAEHLLILDR